MKILYTIRDCTSWREKHHQTIGFVPTMGALHAGHLSLVQKSKDVCSKTIVSIYVNPSQFSANEDLLSYPKTLDVDLGQLKKLNLDAVFLPNDKEMFSDESMKLDYKTKLFNKLEGSSRPHFFPGVTKVVSKLFDVIRPTHTFFGEKDAQQSYIIKKMISDLNLNIEFIACPTKRDKNGLAFSSRNAYLNSINQKKASLLYLSLMIVKNAIKNGEKDTQLLKKLFKRSIKSDPAFKIDYISIACGVSLDELKNIQPNALISAAVFYKKVRLIDNFVYSST